MTISTAFDKFKNCNILVIGDVMIDSYMWGKVERISPEAPIPIVSVQKRENRLGGAANVAMNIKSMGAKPIICSIVGKDENGKLLKSILDEEKLSSEAIIESETRKTTIKTRVISNNQQMLRVDEEEINDISKSEEILLFGKIDEILNTQKINAIVFEDYDKGVLTAKLIQKIIEIANQKNISVLADPKKNNFSNYKNIQLFKPNFKEFTSGLKINIDKNNFAEISTHANEFCKTQNIENILITLSEKGSIICNNNTFRQFDALKIDISDVSGAGDTVIAVASLCLSVGLAAEQTAQISNIAGSLVCEKIGVVQIDKEELLFKCDNLVI
jgi:rfaE bifunctional protein kinase chain/domain